MTQFLGRTYVLSASADDVTTAVRHILARVPEAGRMNYHKFQALAFGAAVLVLKFLDDGFGGGVSFDRLAERALEDPEYYAASARLFRACATYAGSVSRSYFDTFFSVYHTSTRLMRAERYVFFDCLDAGIDWDWDRLKAPDDGAAHGTHRHHHGADVRGQDDAPVVEH